MHHTILEFTREPQKSNNTLPNIDGLIAKQPILPQNDPLVNELIFQKLWDKIRDLESEIAAIKSQNLNGDLLQNKDVSSTKHEGLKLDLSDFHKFIKSKPLLKGEKLLKKNVEKTKFESVNTSKSTSKMHSKSKTKRRSTKNKIPKSVRPNCKENQCQNIRVLGSQRRTSKNSIQKLSPSKCKYNNGKSNVK